MNKKNGKFSAILQFYLRTYKVLCPTRKAYRNLRSFSTATYVNLCWVVLV